MPLDVRNLLDQDYTGRRRNPRVYRQNFKKVAKNNNQKADDVNVILNYGKLKKLMEKDLLCKKCEENNSEQELDEFAKYVDEHANTDGVELLTQFKDKKKHVNEIKLTKDTIGISTSLTCKYENGCKFNVPHEKIKWEGKK